MKLTILGSGGCMDIPKALCRCRICREARLKGPPFERTGPSAFLHDANLLIDTPAESNLQLNRAAIDRVDYLIFTHLDPDHIEGFRVVEQITLDFRTWEAYPEKQIELVLPEEMLARLRQVRTAYGGQLAFFEKQGFIRCRTFNESITLGDVKVSALPVHRQDQVAYIYVFESKSQKIVYAPCDIKPFPEENALVWEADLLVIQPGMFETGLRHGFVYPADHISRTTLYTFEDTVALSRRIQARQVLFVHLEEYWQRSHDDYVALENDKNNYRFAYDGLCVTL